MESKKIFNYTIHIKRKTMTFHQEVLDLLLKYREKNPDFNFVARQLNRKGKLDDGYYFQGNDRYAFAGIINKSGGLKMTKSVGLIFFPLEDHLKCDFEIKYKGETNQDLIAFYEELKFLFPEVEQVEDEYFKVPIGEINRSNLEPLYQFLDRYYPKIRLLAEKSDLKKLIISDEKFDKILQNIQQRPKEVNYWVFQGSPEIYDIEKALRAAHLKSWKVAAHKDKIKPGDKVILWQTGEKAGCYALAEVISEVGQIQEESFEKQYYKDQTSTTKEKEGVKIKVTSYLADDPVLWADIKELPEFQHFKAGNQGTNFSATKEEYETIEEIGGVKTKSYYREIKALFPREKMDPFLHILRGFIAKHNLDPRDERISFNVRPERKRLVFIIGNRYALMIQKRKNETEYSFISPDVVSEDYGLFNNYKGEVEMYWNKVQDLKGFETAIEKGFNIELDRQNRTPYRKHSDQEFINDVLKTSKGIPLTTTNDGCLNRILYGPPGTGKTYYSKELAVRLANPQFSTDGLPAEEGREKINEEYQRLYEAGQIVFTTFHQSFSYEDFVEGIKPVTPEKEGAPITYEVQNGVFKNLCLKAKTPNQQNFDSAYSSLVKDLALDQEVKKIKTPTGKTFGISLNSLNNLNLHTGEQMKKQGTLTRENILREISQEEDYPYWKGYFQGVINHLTEKYDYREKKDLATRNYVLIIDEINRGNVSAIFGELITLLEADKRKGKDEEISVELPYSKKPFTIPSNLYIIGTMNTADRSVEALDTALRRRFVFEEIMPRPELLRNIEFEGFNLEELLSTINERIEALLDRDHTIGHSYFIKTNSGDTEALQEAFENKIIPLLQEYFYHDYEKIALILGAGFVERKEGKVSFAKFPKLDLPEVLPSYHLREVEDIESAVQILLNRENEAGE